MQKSLTVALAQLSGGNTVTDNAQRLQTFVGKAKHLPVTPDLLIFPEGFLSGYYVENARQSALTKAAASDMLCRQARVNNMALATGYIEREGATLYNAAVVVDERGNELAAYHKRCLYGNWERETFKSGKKTCLFNIRDWRIGLVICYDIEFPEITRELAVAGAEIIIAPTALMAPDEELIFALLPARAIENGVFVAYANRIGRERELRYVGNSRIIDQRGEILAQAGEEEIVIQATLTKSADAPCSAYLQDIARLKQ